MIGKSKIRYHEYVKVNGLWSYVRTVRCSVPLRRFKGKLYQPAKLATLNNNVTFCS